MAPTSERPEIDERRKSQGRLTLVAFAAVVLAAVGLVYSELRPDGHHPEAAAFMAACMNRDFDAARHTIKTHPWIVECRLRPDGNTLLHWAALHLDTMPAILLLEHGARVNALNEAGRTPYQYATGTGSPFVARALRRRGGGDGPNGSMTPFEVRVSTHRKHSITPLFHESNQQLGTPIRAVSSNLNP